MSRAAFLTTPDSFWGAEEAGMIPRYLEDPAIVPEEVRRLAARGYGLIIVTDDLVPGGGDDLRAVLRQEMPEAVLLVVPAVGSRGADHLSALRGRFSRSLGIDVWEATARRAGVDL